MKKQAGPSRKRSSQRKAPLGRGNLEVRGECVHLLIIAFVNVLFSSEVWLGEYEGKKVAIKMLKDLKDNKAGSQFITEAAVMT